MQRNSDRDNIVITNIDPAHLSSKRLFGDRDIKVHYSTNEYYVHNDGSRIFFTVCAMSIIKLLRCLLIVNNTTLGQKQI